MEKTKQTLNFVIRKCSSINSMKSRKIISRQTGGKLRKQLYQLLQRVKLFMCKCMCTHPPPPKQNSECAAAFWSLVCNRVLLVAVAQLRSPSPPWFSALGAFSSAVGLAVNVTPAGIRYRGTGPRRSSSSDFDRSPTSSLASWPANAV